jgi:hypothetical protein
MRVSPVGFAFEDEERVIVEAAMTAEEFCHRFGIKVISDE